MRDKPAVLGGAPAFNDIIPITQPTLPQNSALADGIDSILKSGMITSAKFTQEFEQRVKEYLGVRHAVALSSCTNGLMLAVRALAVKGEVILPSFTFYATCHAAVWNNLTPIFVDCDRETYNISPAEVERAISPRTSAIIAVHLFGNPANIDALESIAEKHSLKLIFDAAHGFGAEYRGKKLGSEGDSACFSLSPTKLITAGEGGVVTTNNKELAEKIRIGKNYGDPGTYNCQFLGLSARMPEFSALLGIKCLEMLEENVKARNRLAGKYMERLSKIPGITFQKIEHENRSSYKDFSIYIDRRKFGVDRDVLCDALAGENIVTKKYFYPPLHKQKLFEKYHDKENGLKATEDISFNSLSLPLYSHMTADDVNKVCEAIERVYNYSEQIKQIHTNP